MTARRTRAVILSAVRREGSPERSKAPVPVRRDLGVPTISAGSRLGPYEVIAPLGAGGMGEVWRARDPRLGREVAIKVLPEEVSSDRERVGRFEREARAASALNHPNIVTIHEVGEAEGRAYSSWSGSKGRRFARFSRKDRCRCAGCFLSPRRRPTAWRERTKAGSFTGT